MTSAGNALVARTGRRTYPARSAHGRADEAFAGTTGLDLGGGFFLDPLFGDFALDLRTTAAP